MSDNSEIVIPSKQSHEYALAVLKGTITAIPYVGGVIDEVLFEARARNQQDRLNALFSQTKLDVEELGEEKLDKEFIHSERFVELVEEICTRTAKTASETRRARFRKIFVDLLQGKNDDDFELLFISFISTMSEGEIKVLAGFMPFLEAQRQAGAEGRRLEATSLDYSKPMFGVGGEVARQCILALISRGLLLDDSLGRFDTSPLTIVVPTELGERFSNWLQA